MIPRDSGEPAYEARLDPGVVQLLHEQGPEVPRRATDVPSPPWGPVTVPFPVIEPAEAPAEPVAPAESRPRTSWAGPAIVIVAIGVLGQAWLGYQGRTTGGFSSVLWYVTLGLIFVPPTALIMSGRITDRAKIWFALYMALALLATRFVLYPQQFAYHDELLNYRVLLSIEQTRHLFTPNSLLPDTADYPGMEIATAAVHQLTGLSLHSAGFVVLAAVRVVMTLALIRIIQMVTGNVTAGCLTAAIYTTNPQYVFFNSQFSYESVALPLCFFCVYVIALSRSTRSPLSVIPGTAIILAVAATHHLTSVALVIVLWVWYLFTRISKRPVRQLLPLAVVSLVIVAAWTWLARAVIIPYLSEITNNSLSNLTTVLRGTSSHKFFTDSAGDRSPAWQELLSLASVLLITLTLIPSVWLAITKHRLLSAGAMTLFAIAALYPIVPAGHLTDVTAEVTDRASGFVFVGLGYIVAAWWLRDDPFHRHAKTSRFTVRRRTWLLVTGLTVCFAGGAVLSGPDWVYGPGSYLVSADNRSVDQLALQAAYWEGRNLPPGSRVFADRVNGVLAGTYGNQHLLTALGDKIDVGSLSNLLLGPSTKDDDQADARLACLNHVQYLIADQRLHDSLPHLGIYIDNGEYQNEPGTSPSPPLVSELTKFDNVAGAQRIFDNGSIRIYDLRSLPCAG